jgi:RHS repeat-associated protein
VCIPVFDWNTNNRGNVTTVTRWADPTNNSDPDKSTNTFKYDIVGNVIEATMSCCNIKTIEYDDEFHYAYPTKETKGASPTQLVTEADYDFNTGLLESTEDENDQVTDYEYDSPTLRATEVTFPNGAWSQFEYNDSTFPYHVKTTRSIDSSRSVSGWGFFNGIGQSFRSRQQTANGYLSNDVEYDEMGRAFKSFNPYTVSNIGDARPSGIKSTEATLVDALGRVLTTRLQDDTTTSVEFNDSSTTPSSPSLFNRAFVTITDQAGKKRRQLFDGLGRLVRVDEPVVDSSPLGAVDSPHQPTSYEYDGNDNVTKVTQVSGTVTQERLFKYDAMSRLTHERQAEADPTLDNSGVKQTSGGLWTGFYTYTPDGMIQSGTDSRGVKTEFYYDGLDRLTSVVYTGESGYQTPTVTYTYDQAEGSYKNLGRLTRIQTPSNATYGIPATEQNYDYDVVGQIKKHVQTINGQSYQLEYGYNLAGQLITETYPSGRVVTMTVDNFGLPQTIADSQQTYLTGFSNNSQGLPSQVSFGNGTTESFAFNDRLQSTSKSLQRGSTVLQKYDYSYGQVTVTNGNVDTSKNNGQLGKVEAWIGSNKQWSQRFAYDEVGRLSESREHRGDNDALTYKQRFDFDRFGNLYRKSANNPTTGQGNPLPYTPIEDSDIDKEKNRIVTDTTYDAAGNVTQDDLFRGIAAVYDANHRVAKVTPTGASDAHSVYDGLGNRVATKINGVWEYIIYDTFGKLVAEYGVAKVGGGGTKYLQQDWQGSTRTVTNSNGYVIGRTDYQAFGETISAGVGLRSIDTGHAASQTARQGYALTENDKASDQQHTWFRKLETKGGRWTSPDPYNALASRKADPQSLNKYGYVRGEPTNFVDPTGLMMQVCGFNDNGDVVCVGTGGGGGYGGGSGGSSPGGSTWYGSGWYGSAANSYQVAQALAGGFFGEGAPRGRLTRVDRMRNNTEDEWSLFGNYYFTPDFGGYTGIDRSCAEGVDPGVSPTAESSGDCAYSSYKACESAQKNICHAEGEERFWHVMSTGGFTATGVGAAIGTVFAPGLGTAIGGVVGGTVGTYAAARAGEATEKRCRLQIPEKCVACKGT